MPAELVCAPEPEALLEAAADEGVAEVGEMMMVVLLLAETVRRVVEFPAPTTMVLRPGPTAGMVATGGWLVTTAGWVVTTPGCSGIEVAAAGWPVMTPSELVSVRREVWGKASSAEEEDCARAATAKIGAAKKIEARMVDVCLFECFGERESCV